MKQRLKDKLIEAIEREIEHSVEYNYWEWIDRLTDLLIKIKNID